MSRGPRRNLDKAPWVNLTFRSTKLGPDMLRTWMRTRNRKPFIHLYSNCLLYLLHMGATATVRPPKVLSPSTPSARHFICRINSKVR
jgi:hypothetical protein